MHREFSGENAGVDWLLSVEEDAFIRRYKGKNRFQCAVLLKFFQTEGRFPRSFDEIPKAGLSNLSIFLGSYDPQSGTSIRQRADIREFLGFSPPRTEDYAHAQDWLCTEVNRTPVDDGWLSSSVREWFRDHRIELPSVGQVERIVRSSLALFEDRLFRGIAALLSDDSKQALDQLLVPQASVEADGPSAPFSLLKADPGKPSLNSVFAELSKLADIDAVNLPAGLFDSVSGKTLHLHRSHAATESVRDMRLHPDHIQHTLAAAFCYERRQEIIDGLIELLIQIVHTIRVRAEKKVIKELVASIRDSFR